MDERKERRNKRWCQGTCFKDLSDFDQVKRQPSDLLKEQVFNGASGDVEAELGQKVCALNHSHLLQDFLEVPNDVAAALYSALARQAGNARNFIRVVVKAALALAAELELYADVQLRSAQDRRPCGTNRLGISSHGAIRASRPFRGCRPRAATKSREQGASR